MKQETKFDIFIALVLFIILLALFSLSPLIPKISIWGILYFALTLTIGLLLGIVINHLKT